MLIPLNHYMMEGFQPIPNGVVTVYRLAPNAQFVRVAVLQHSTYMYTERNGQKRDS